MGTTFLTYSVPQSHPGRKLRGNENLRNFMKSRNLKEVLNISMLSVLFSTRKSHCLIFSKNAGLIYATCNFFSHSTFSATPNLWKTSFFFQLQYDELLFKTLNKRVIFDGSHRELFVPWKIHFPKLGNAPTKIKMLSITFFCQGDLL